MKLKTYNATTSPSARRGEAYIRFNRKAGAIVLSKEAARVTGITKGLELLQDEDRPTDWYIKASEAPEAFITRKDRNSQHLIFNAASVTRTIEKSLGKDFNGQASFKFPVASQPVEGEPGLFALLTRAVSNPKVTRFS